MQPEHQNQLNQNNLQTLNQRATGCGGPLGLQNQQYATNHQPALSQTGFS